MLDGGSVGAFYPGASTNKYIYSTSDHLSNTRVTVSADKVSGAAVVISSADYYAWGIGHVGAFLPETKLRAFSASFCVFEGT